MSRVIKKTDISELKDGNEIRGGDIRKQIYRFFR